MTDVDVELLSLIHPPGAPTPTRLDFNIDLPYSRPTSIASGPGKLFDFHKYSQTWPAPLHRAPSGSTAFSQPRCTEEDRGILEAFLVPELTQHVSWTWTDTHGMAPSALLQSTSSSPPTSSSHGLRVAPSRLPSPFTPQRLLRNSTITNMLPTPPLASEPVQQRFDWVLMFQDPLPSLEDLPQSGEEWDDDAEQEELDSSKGLVLPMDPGLDWSAAPASPSLLEKEYGMTEFGEHSEEEVGDSYPVAKPLRRTGTPFHFPVSSMKDIDLGDVVERQHALVRNVSGLSETGSEIILPAQLLKRKLAVMIKTVELALNDTTTEVDTDDGYETEPEPQGPRTRSRSTVSAKRRRVRLFNSNFPTSQAQHFCRWSDPVTGVRCRLGFLTPHKLLRHLAETHIQQELQYAHQGQIEFTDAVAIILVTYHRLANGRGHHVYERNGITPADLYVQALQIKNAAKDGLEPSWDKLFGFREQMHRTVDIVFNKMTCILCGKREQTWKSYVDHRLGCKPFTKRSGLKKDKTFRLNPHLPKSVRWKVRAGHNARLG